MWSTRLLNYVALILMPTTTTMAFSQTSKPVLSHVTSSPFEMVLFPTYDGISMNGTTILEDAIKTSLTMMASSSTIFSILEIDIILQNMKWKHSSSNQGHNIDANNKGNPSTCLHFTAYCTFFNGGQNNNAASIPSRFSLDNLVIQAFSQPSSKSNFVEQLKLSNESVLIGIDHIEISYIENNMTTLIDRNTPIKSSRTITRLDIILIITSFIVVGAILFVIYKNEKDRINMDEQHRLHQGITTSTTGLSPTGGCQGSETAFETTNIIEPLDGSHLQDDEESRRTYTPTMKSPDNNRKPFALINSPRIFFDQDTIQLSETPTSSSPPMFVSCISSVTASKNSGPEKSASSDSSPLNPRVLCPQQSDNMGNVLSKVEDSLSKCLTERPLTSSCNDQVQGEIASASLSSSCSASGSLSSSTLHTQSSSSSTTSTGANDSSNLSIGTTGNTEFESKWFKDKAELAIDEDSDDNYSEDVFKVDVDAVYRSQGDGEQNKFSKISDTSEWMESLRVVNSCSETKTNSSTEHSSVEPSSVEPTSTQQHNEEHMSVDFSLERSLATSIVEL